MKRRPSASDTVAAAGSIEDEDRPPATKRSSVLRELKTSPSSTLPSLAALRVASRVPRVQHLVFGASGIGCLYRDVPMERARATVEAVLDRGFDYVDTAPWYGAGLSETRLGELLAQSGGVKLSTKCGRVIRSRADVSRQGEHAEPHYEGHFVTEAYHSNVPVADYTADGVRESFRQSCDRLGRRSLDVLRLHDAEGEERYAAALAGGAVEAMLELRRGGQVSEIGLGMGRAEYALKYLRTFSPGTFDSLMLAGSWNLIDQDGLEVLQECQRLGVRVHNVGIFASGVLWGGPYYKYGEIPAIVADKVRGWQSLAESFGFTLPEVALSFALLPEVVERVAVGCSTPAEVIGNVDLCGKFVPSALWCQAKERGLLDLDVPIPCD